MIEITVPGYPAIVLEHLILDYNGTIALDGKLIPGVKERLLKLSEHLQIHILTADTHGTVQTEVKDIPCQVTVLPAGTNHIEAKRDLAAQIGAEVSVAMGNGRNDFRMLGICAVGICILGEEGASFQSLSNADIICPSVLSALDLLLYPKRLIATMRSN